MIDRSSLPPILQTRELAIRYGALAALEDVSLEIRRSAITAVIGPSGCGKTSFLQALNRLTDLAPQCRVSGQVLFAGQDIYSRQVDPLDLRRRIGMIFQKPNPFPLSIRRNVELALCEHGVPRSERSRRVEAALQSAGLWSEVKDRLGASALSLSGGQQQRLCLARALALAPEVLLLDEPCSALDPASTALVEEQLLALRERTTMIIVTHNLAQARRLADEAAFFSSDGGPGRLIEAGPAAEFFTSPRHSRTSDYLNRQA